MFFDKKVGDFIKKGIWKSYRMGLRDSERLYIGNRGKSIANIVVQTTDGQRVPISVNNVEIVGFKKEWWQFWKK